MVANILLAGGAGQGNTLVALLPFILIFVVIWLFMIRPQSRKQKELQAMLKSLQKGDRVITIGGIKGSIVGFKEADDTVVLKIADNTKIEVTRSGIAKKLP
ncbi:preprotein translocase subunit YajC [bacterium BMS3Abin05]|nr:preprotein translocase subunit YajC [bacterium BMS3Abin05]GBE26269.1 preprotein translocase subunit YajC [bacterium BMS3Bbin03]HDK35487.1 preprotein translocase subunit YajC [Bacteroidota bacterium]HDZ10889.1 preprotein translocase subunit YajC [Bacteroidota bacterium]